MTIASGGVLPKIHPELLSRKRGSKLFSSLLPEQPPSPIPKKKPATPKKKAAVVPKKVATTAARGGRAANNSKAISKTKVPNTELYIS